LGKFSRDDLLVDDLLVMERENSRWNGPCIAPQGWFGINEQPPQEDPMWLFVLRLSAGRSM
jgi:hypothetical protein